MTQLPRGAYIPERPGYLPLETEQNAAEMSSTPAQDRQRQREVEQRDGEMRPPSYYAACPKGQPPGRDGEQEDEDELAELDDTQVKSVLNGEGP